LDKSPFWEKISYREFTGIKQAAALRQKLSIPVMWIPVVKRLRLSNGLEYEAGESLDVDDLR